MAGALLPEFDLRLAELFSAQAARISLCLGDIPRQDWLSAAHTGQHWPSPHWTGLQCPSAFRTFTDRRAAMDDVLICGPPWILECLLAWGVPTFTGRTCCVCQASPVLQPHPELRLLWECDDQEYCIKCWFTFWVEREHDCQFAMYNPAVRPMDDASVLALELLTTNQRKDWSFVLRLKALFWGIDAPRRSTAPLNPIEMQSAQPKLDWTAALQRLRDANLDPMTERYFFFIGAPWMLERFMMWGVPTFSGRTCAQCRRTPLLQPDDYKFVREHDDPEYCILCWVRFWSDRGNNCQDVVFFPKVDPYAIVVAELIAEELRSVPKDAWASVLRMCALLLEDIKQTSRRGTRPTSTAGWTEIA
jgi:hypothetical protein